jgi:DNA-binding response OmpR family regulator
MEPIAISSTLRILLVEDDEHDRLAFRRAFHKTQAACEITECVRAEDALKRLRADASSFELVFVDHQLPGMSGLDLCRELLDEQISLPLVIITGKGSEQLAVEALKAGVDDYIIKDPGERYLDLLPLTAAKVLRKYRDRIARKCSREALRKAHNELKELVEELTAELERRNQELEKIACIASYDLQEPLRTVRFNLRMLERRCEGRLDEDADAHMVSAADGVNRISRIIDNLLAH